MFNTLNRWPLSWLYNVFRSQEVWLNRDYPISRVQYPSSTLRNLSKGIEMSILHVYWLCRESCLQRERKTEHWWYAWKITYTILSSFYISTSNTIQCLGTSFLKWDMSDIDKVCDRNWLPRVSISMKVYINNMCLMLSTKIGPIRNCLDE